MRLPYTVALPVVMLISLWINLPAAWAWGELGHKIMTENGTALADPVTLKNCHVTAAQLVEHTNDPDKIWRQKRGKYRDEAHAHFFHVDQQPKDWKTRSSAQNPKKGFLVYKIVDWVEEAKKARKAKDWETLSERLYGLSHYVGDLVQPLHAHHDYDGDEAGLSGVHSQFETKMLNRFDEEVLAEVKRKIRNEKIPAYWSGLEVKNLIFDTAEQSFAKAPRLFEQTKTALQMPKTSKKRRNRSKNQPSPRFIKAILWKQTGNLATDQLATGARLWGFVLNNICK